MPAAAAEHAIERAHAARQYRGRARGLGGEREDLCGWPWRREKTRRDATPQVDRRKVRRQVLATLRRRWSRQLRGPIATVATAAATAPAAAAAAATVIATVTAIAVATIASITAASPTATATGIKGFYRRISATGDPARHELRVSCTCREICRRLTRGERGRRSVRLRVELLEVFGDRLELNRPCRELGLRRCERGSDQGELVRSGGEFGFEIGDARGVIGGRRRVAGGLCVCGFLGVKQARGSVSQGQD